MDSLRSIEAIRSMRPVKYDLLKVLYRMNNILLPWYEIRRIARFRGIRKRTRLPRWVLWKAIFITDKSPENWADTFTFYSLAGIEEAVVQGIGLKSRFY